LLHAGLGKADPYAIITCGAQAQKSLIAKDQGSDPSWNQTFKFNILDNRPMDLCIELYNKNTFKDNKIGIIRIGLQQVFSKKKTSAILYNVMRPNTNKIQGEIEVQLSFEPKERGSTSNLPSPLSKEKKPTSIGEMATTRRWAATASDQSSPENHTNGVKNLSFSFPALSPAPMGYPAVQVVSQFDSAPVTGYPAVYPTTYQSDFNIPKGISSYHPEDKLTYYLAGTPATSQSVPSDNHIGVDKHPQNNSPAGPIQFEQGKQPNKKSHHRKSVKSSKINHEPWKQPETSNGGSAKDGRRHSKRRSALAATVVVAEASAIILVQLAQVFVLATAVAVGGSC
jgi:hypothetical protein